jgi:hypothetical protein
VLISVYINTMKHLITLLFTIFSISSYAQLKVDQSGEGWKEMVDSALILIKKVDPEKYEHIETYCTKIGFWNGSFSSNEGTEIFISREDILLGSVENICCILVHESKHIELSKKGLPLQTEECICYNYEMSFLNKLENVDWLKQNCFLRLNQYECDI